MNCVKECQSTERGYVLAPAGSSPARKVPELERAPQKNPCIFACMKPTCLAGIPTPHPPGNIAEDLAAGHWGCCNVHVRDRVVPQRGSKGSAAMGGMLLHCYP